MCIINILYWGSKTPLKHDTNMVTKMNEYALPTLCQMTTFSVLKTQANPDKSRALCKNVIY